LEKGKQIMAKKRKGLAGAMSENQLAATVRESAQQIWLAGLGAFSTAREQGNKVFEALAKEGEAFQSLAQKAAGARLTEAAAKAGAARHKLEQVFEDSAARAMKRFGLPTSKDIDALSKRVVALTALIDKITAEAARKRVAAKPATASRRARTAPRRAGAR
jgi:poly(hydroxyalkanoate) granule-associated protein